MVTTIRQSQEPKSITPDTNSSLDNEIDFLRYLGQVKSKVRDAITEDFTLAKLEDKDKEAVIEMSVNAFYILRVYALITEKATKWEWIQQENGTIGYWEERHYNKEEKKLLNERGETAFSAYMSRVLMTVIMNRNKPGNDLVENLMGKIRDIREQGEPQTIEISNGKNKKKKKDEEAES